MPLLQAGIREAARSRAEKLYVDAVLTLVKTDPAHLGGEGAARDILCQLNALLDGSHVVEKGRAEVRAAQGARPVEELEAEVTALYRQSEAATDSLARATLRQSADIARARLESIRSLSGIAERLDAQQEVVCQTLASVQTALARMRVAPSPAADAAHVQEVSETVSRINAQTRAVEQAVQEVMSLRGGG